MNDQIRCPNCFNIQEASYNDAGKCYCDQCGQLLDEIFEDDYFDEEFKHMYQVWFL